MVQKAERILTWVITFFAVSASRKSYFETIGFAQRHEEAHGINFVFTILRYAKKSKDMIYSNNAFFSRKNDTRLVG